MIPQDDLLVFDEDEAIKYIYSTFPAELKKKISKDDIDYVLDIMYEFYEKNGLIEEDSADEANIDEEDMFAFIMQCIKEDKIISITDDELQIILDGEYEYGKSIGIYTEIE